jgi:hypothetical protein
MNLSRTITILVALGTACMATATAVQAVNQTWGMILTIVGIFLTTFTRSILEAPKSEGSDEPEKPTE